LIIGSWKKGSKAFDMHAHLPRFQQSLSDLCCSWRIYLNIN
jgi:hypothetical protein